MATPRRIDLEAAAERLMRENGFDPEFPPAVAEQLAATAGHPPAADGPAIRDMRDVLWSSIDNDTSRDLDQVEVVESRPDQTTVVRIAIADVDAYVPARTPIDAHAQQSCTTVYTAVRNFPMLPESLSTGATSLLEGQERLALVFEFEVSADGAAQACTAYRARVVNKAQLAYDDVGPWLEGRGAPPPKVAASADLKAQLTAQYACAERLRAARYRHGALNVQTIETRAVMQHGEVVDVAVQRKNAATDLIEDFMIAANQTVAQVLDARRVSSIRRVVKSPERWPRIVDLAKQDGVTLPAAPDSKALNDFLTQQRARDPLRFADLSLAVIKLMGPGEYVLMRPGDPEQSHFGLAVQDYTHSTAPNRRYADLIMQRLLKAALVTAAAPYSDTELADLARQCTLREDAARKVELEVAKRVAAVAMSGRIGQTFDALVTGVTPRGTFVRVLEPHVEGLLARGQQGVDVGDKLRVTLLSTDPERGFIDFGRAAH